MYARRIDFTLFVMESFNKSLNEYYCLSLQIKESQKVYYAKDFVEKELGMYGKMGEVINLYNQYKETNEEKWEIIAGNLLDEIIEGCDNHLPLDYGSGLCGIGVGIEWLIQNNYIEGDADNILAEIDWKILYAINARNITQTSICHGILGIAYFIIERRLKHPSH